MKTLFVFSIAFLFAFFLGCESTVNDPLDSDNESNTGYTETVAYKDIISYYSKSVRLGGMLLDPSHPMNSTAEIKGIVRYRIDRNFTDPGNTGTGKFIRIQMYIDARVIGGCNGFEHPWTVLQATNDLINITFNYDPAWNLQKTIRVRGTCCCPLNLVLKFKIEDKELKLYSMHLKKVPGLVRVGDPAQ
jgi:hypothetical protein